MQARGAAADKPARASFVFCRSAPRHTLFYDSIRVSDSAAPISSLLLHPLPGARGSAAAKLRFLDMASRHCTNRVFLTGGSGILSGAKSRGAASRRHSAVRFSRCWVRANMLRTDHRPLRISTSEIIAVLQGSDVFSSIKKWSRIELAKCISNPSCAANVACLQTCNNRPDETECQIKCGDLFENSVVDQFNECAVSRKKCVPKKSDVGEFPVPDPSALVKNFNMADFDGKWYISSGLNPTFDAFDCQLHEFHVEGDKLVGNLTWRIRTPDNGFFTRSAVQRFVQDPSQPAILYNHDNEYLHYQDDWYIISSKVENKEDDYIFVYYRGRNDAWDGYGGAVLYTRSKVVPETIIPEVERAAKSVGRDFSTFIRTDNTCGPEPPLAERIEKTVEQGEKTIIREVQEIEGEIEGEVEELEKEESTLLQRLAEGFMEVKQDVMNFLQGLSKEEMELLDQLNMEATEVEEVFSRALPLRKLR
ncbi:hypothetical protein EJB05_37339, partial [Eragrostis curvula]